MQKKLILIRDDQYERYNGIGLGYDDDELLILKEYLCTAMGYDLDWAPIAKNYIRRSIDFDSVGSEIIGDKVKVDHLFLTNLKNPEIPKEEFFALVDKWFELIAAKAEQIVITNDNGKFSIGTE